MKVLRMPELGFEGWAQFFKVKLGWGACRRYEESKQSLLSGPENCGLKVTPRKCHKCTLAAAQHKGMRNPGDSPALHEALQAIPGLLKFTTALNFRERFSCPISDLKSH